MHYQHLCASHALEIQFDEVAALEFWNRSMHQGISTYAHCRWDCAIRYLHAAFEVSAIRLAASKNTLFTCVHALKPIEFLVEVLVHKKAFQQCLELLHSTTELLNKMPSTEPSLVPLVKIYATKLKASVARWPVEDALYKRQVTSECEALIAVVEAKNSLRH